MKCTIIKTLIFTLGLVACVPSSKNNGGNSNAANSPATQTQLSYDNSAQVDTFLQLVADIDQRAPTLSSEEDRRGKLWLALGLNLNQGCMANVPVKSLQVTINGQKFGDLDVTQIYNGKDNPPLSTGATIFELDFGNVAGTNTMTFSFNEVTNDLFGQNASMTFVPANANFTVGMISSFRLRKANAAFTITDTCDGSTFLHSCTDNRSITEIERYFLSSLAIAVNGQQIYSLGNIAHTFASYGTIAEAARSVGLEWDDVNVQINSAYLQAMQLTDCTSLMQ